MNYICIEDFHPGAPEYYKVTLGNVYETNIGSKYYIYIYDDCNKPIWINKNYFSTKEEIRDDKLSSIGI